MRFSLLQIGQVLLHQWGGIASGQPAQVSEHTCWPLVLEPVQHSLQQPAGNLPPVAGTACPMSLRYSAACARVEDADRIRTVVVDQPL
jgi:hypothetical protein